jgi:hypothetical protein
MLCQYCEEREESRLWQGYCSRLCRALDRRENARFGKRLPWNHRIWRTDEGDPMHSTWPAFADYVAQYFDAYGVFNRRARSGKSA